MFELNAFIVDREVLNSNTYSFILRADEIAKIAKPGQFVHICLDGFVLRRPISICEVQGDCIRIVFQIRGKGTKKMAELGVTEYMNILGPLGSGFREVYDSDRLLVIGGGIGSPPMLELAKRVKFVKTILGFKSSDNVILEEDYGSYGDVIVCTQDGKYGEKGIVTDFIERVLVYDNINRAAVCGPKSMLRSVANILNGFNVFCEVSLEERMACGIGSCLGCQCFLDINGKKISKRVCKDGPVFNSAEVVF